MVIKLEHVSLLIMNHLLNKDNRVRIYTQDRLETKLIQDWPLSSIISSEIKLCTLNLPMFIWTFIDKLQSGPALRYFSSHVCESKRKIDKSQDGPALWYFASHVHESKCKSLILIWGNRRLSWLMLCLRSLLLKTVFLIEFQCCCWFDLLVESCGMHKTPLHFN